MVVLQPLSLPASVNLFPNHPKPAVKCFRAASSNFSVSGSKSHEHPISAVPFVNQNVAAIVFGDGSESQLYPLTRRRSEGAIPIGANYRLIDAVVSNCINSSINKIYAITQYNSTSLNSHLSRAYSGAGLGKEGFVEVIAAYQSPEDQGWFQGNADATRRCLWVLEEFPVAEYMVLPGYHLYKMDYQKVIEAHRSRKADITVVGLSAMRDEDPGFGFLQVNYENQVLGFTDKLESHRVNKCCGNIGRVWKSITCGDVASIGVYVISREVMIKLLTEHFPTANDFKSQVIPGAISLHLKVQAYLFDGYWEGMRTIEAFYTANLECTKKTDIGYNFYDKGFPVYTLPRYLPPTIITDDAVITDSVIGDGCVLHRCTIKGTVVGLRTRIRDGAVIEDSVILGSDTYQTEEIQGTGARIPIGIGENAYIKKAIVDKNARIGRNVKIINKDNVQEGNQEANGYIISSGIVVILKSAVIPDDSFI